MRRQAAGVSPWWKQVRIIHARFSRLLSAAVLLGATFLSGCNEPEEVQAVPKRADDRITPAELESFLSIVNSLPEPKRPQIPSVMPAAPQWSRNRTLPVNELVREEEKFRIERESIDWLAARCPQSRFLKRALRRETMTIEQFIGLYRALPGSDAPGDTAVP